MTIHASAAAARPVRLAPPPASQNSALSLPLTALFLHPPNPQYPVSRGVWLSTSSPPP